MLAAGSGRHLMQLDWNSGQTWGSVALSFQQ
jgi:hypothetical protein